ncbi:MAG: transporter, CPA2 family [Candidatus Nitrotoga sp. MKT]|nr:MAG: transporter, CPA2 family [Candidatus Nitrotoga sp. MKT]
MDFLPTWPIELNTMTSFSILLVAGAIGGYLAHTIRWLPSITGFMLLGYIAGPSGVNLLSVDALSSSRVIIDIALGLILYRLGLSLDIKTVLRSQYLLFATILETVATLLAVYFVLRYFNISNLTAALIAAICTSSSPAVLIHVGHELGAKGPVTDSAGSLVALNNVISFLVFSALLPVGHIEAGASWQVIVFQPLYRLLGSFLLAIIIGYGLHYLILATRETKQYRLALVIGATMLALGLANALVLSILFAPLALGIIVRNIEHENLVSNIEFGETFELFFIVLFVFAGANLHVHELIQYAPAAIALVFARGLSKWLGVFVAAKSYRIPTRAAVSTGLLLVPMAGLAIGLVQTTGQLFPQEIATVSALVLGAVAIFETIGPLVAAWAFKHSGEAGKKEA